MGLVGPDEIAYTLEPSVAGTDPVGTPELFQVVRLSTDESLLRLD